MSTQSGPAQNTQAVSNTPKQSPRGSVGWKRMRRILYVSILLPVVAFSVQLVSFVANVSSIIPGENPNSARLNPIKHEIAMLQIKSSGTDVTKQIISCCNQGLEICDDFELKSIRAQAFMVQGDLNNAEQELRALESLFGQQKNGTWNYLCSFVCRTGPTPQEESAFLVLRGQVSQWKLREEMRQGMKEDEIERMARKIRQDFERAVQLSPGNDRYRLISDRSLDFLTPARL